MSEIYTGNKITIENFGYNKANINIKGNREQKIIEEVKGNTVIGTNIVVNDVEKEQGKITIKGNAEQEVTEQSNNLLILENKTQTINGVTVTFEDGVVTVNGTSTNSVNIDIPIKKKIQTGEYRHAISSVSGTSSPKLISYIIFNKSTNEVIHSINGSGGSNFNLTEDTEVYYRIWIASDVVVDNRVVKILINKATDEAVWIEGVPTMPSPDYPSEVKTVGKNVNLLSYPFEDTTKTIAGINFVDNGDGTITANGTATGTVYFNLSKPTLKRGKYCISGIPVGASGTTYEIKFGTKNYYSNTMFEILNDSFTPNESYIKINSGVTVNDLTFKPKIEEGIVVTPYSLYGQGSVEIDVVNKNLLDLNKKGYSESSSKLNGATVVVNDGIITVNATNATATAEVKSTWNPYNDVSSILIPKGKYYSDLKLNLVNSKTLKQLQVGDGVTFTIEDDCYLTQWYFLVSVGNTRTCKLQIVRDENKETDYIPHESQRVVIPVQKEFAKIGDYADTFIKQNGKWYEKHYICKKVFDGTNDVGVEGTMTTNTFFFLLYGAEGCIYDERTFDNVLCDKFKYEGGNLWIDDIEGISSPSRYTQNRLWLRINKDRIDGWDDNLTNIEKCTLMKNWLVSNNLTVYYILQTPELIECTEEQQKVLSQLYDFPLYLPTTNLFAKSSTAPNVMLTYNHVIPSPSPDIPSEVKTVGQNVNLSEVNKLIVEKYSSNPTNITGFIETSKLPITIQFKQSNEESYLGYVRYYDENKSLLAQTQHTDSVLLSKGYTIVENKNDAKYVAYTIRGTEGTNTFPLKITDIKTEKGIVATSYSPYGQGSVGIDVVNKNLAILENGGIWDDSGSNRNLANNVRTNFIRFDKTMKITVSWKTILTTKNQIYLLYDKDKKMISNYNYYKNGDTITTTLEEVKYIKMKMSGPSSGNMTIDDFDYFQVESGDTNTEYIPHKCKKIILPIQKEFVKIGDIEDTFIKQDGKWYEKHSVAKVVFDGSEYWQYDQSFNYFRCPAYDYGNNIPLVASIIQYSSHFIINKNWSGTNSFRDNINIQGEFYPISNEGYRICVRNINYTDVNSFKAWLAEQSANGTPVEIYYELATPELIECTPAQENVLNQLENIQLYEGVNNIMSTSFIEPSLKIIVTKAIEDYMCYISTEGKFVIPDSKIEYLIDFNESNIPTMPEATESTVRAAGRNGDIVLATTYEPISLNIVCYTEDNLTLLEKVEEEKKVNKFLNSIKNRTIGLAIEKDNKYYDVKYSGALTTINFPKHLKFAIPLKSSASYGKDLIQKSIVGSEKGESETIEATGATFVIRGPAIKPIISFNDYSMEYNINILEGARVEIDSNKSTATHVNSDGIRTNVMKYYNHQFPKIENGINELKILSGLDNDMNVSVVWNDLKL